MVDSKENDKFDLGVKGLSFSPSSEWRPYAQNINPTVSLWWPIYIIKPFINLVLDQPIIPKLIFIFILIAPFQLFKFHLPNWLMMAYWWPVRFYCKTQKTMNTNIISGMLLCWEKQSNQAWGKLTLQSNNNLLLCSFLVSLVLITVLNAFQVLVVSEIATKLSNPCINSSYHCKAGSI